LTIKKFMGVFLSIAIVAPSGATTTTTGTVRGMISMAGRGLEGLPLVLVNVETGKAFAIRSAADGSFMATLPPGSYVFSSPGRSGVSISRAPLSVDVFSGKVASANVEVTSFGTQDPALPGVGTAKITHDWVDCITEGEFTLIEATFEPLSSVVNGRLYFQSNLSPEWFYTEFEKIEPVVPGGPTHRAFIPKVNEGGGILTINYYLQVTSSDFAETKSLEHSAKVVAGATDCEGKIAPIGNPQGAVSVLSASGASAGSLAGFGGVAGGALIGGGLLIGGGAALLGGTLIVVNNNATPTPDPTSTPVPQTPTPTPATPTPTPLLCTISVFTEPVAPADEFFGGRFCTATVSSGGVNLGVAEGVGRFTIPCNATATVSANVAPQSSESGRKPAFWSGACGGSALGVPCTLAAGQQVSLTCTTR
jgi:hypothetical protein